MSHEIESDYKEGWYDEKSQCQNCTSFQLNGESGFCSEAQAPVPYDAHCDYFQSID